MLSLRTNTGDAIDLDERRDLLGQGGEGSVYAVPGRADLVAKLYHQPGNRRAKIEAMCQTPPADTATPGHVSIAWPTHVLLRSGAFVGFLMKRIANARTALEVSNPILRRTSYAHFSARHLFTVGANLASAINAIHGAGHVVGDINDNNVLVHATALVTVIDTDSFQVRDKASAQVFRCLVGRADFTPPELQDKRFADMDRRPEHDRFGLGVMLFQLAMGGSHPFSGVPVATGTDPDWPIGRRISHGNFAFGRRQSPLAIPPTAFPLKILDLTLQQLFLRCFEAGATSPDARPTALEWQRALRAAADALVPCKDVLDHAFSKHLGACPFCARAKALAVRAAPRATDVPRASTARATASMAGTAGSLSTFGPRPPPAPVPRPAPPPPEITPGRWLLRPDIANMGVYAQSIQAVGGNAKMILTLLGGGLFQGDFEMQMFGSMFPAGLQGQWHYDPNLKTLTINGMVQLRPMNLGIFGMQMPNQGGGQVIQAWLLNSGGNGRFQAFETSSGQPWLVERV